MSDEDVRVVTADYDLELDVREAPQCFSCHAPLQANECWRAADGTQIVIFHCAPEHADKPVHWWRSVYRGDRVIRTNRSSPPIRVASPTEVLA